MPLLEYNKWENFHKAINRAEITCKNSNVNISDHFLEIRKMVKIGSNATREMIDYQLTRYACYLITQNGDSKKKLLL